MSISLSTLSSFKISSKTMSENELNKNQERLVPSRPKQVWNPKWNGNLVQARLQKDVYLRLGHYQSSFDPRKNTSDALNTILDEFLPQLPTTL